MSEMKRDYKIYAVDFDGTLCRDEFPNIGEPNSILIEYLKELRKVGGKVILWTCRVGRKLDEAVEWCKEKGLEFDAINSNLPEVLAFYGREGRKIYADFYIDDKAASLGW